MLHKAAVGNVRKQAAVSVTQRFARRFGGPCATIAKIADLNGRSGINQAQNGPVHRSETPYHGTGDMA
ncbi:hypothetical protein [Ensifer sp. YR511]|uniref:hypothetical protein n=1 Tax=Ensifer sp. YR511 TaxID=1855294 RepID=UPI00088FA3D0|nr:hypothetical protein [Ensifer sp. YR511]SDN05328.1 hypothetical protein SAMN05216328_117109 [Ensifer sp. YR511]